MFCDGTCQDDCKLSNKKRLTKTNDRNAEELRWKVSALVETTSHKPYYRQPKPAVLKCVPKKVISQVSFTRLVDDDRKLCRKCCIPIEKASLIKKLHHYEQNDVVVQKFCDYCYREVYKYINMERIPAEYKAAVQTKKICNCRCCFEDYNNRIDVSRRGFRDEPFIDNNRQPMSCHCERQELHGRFVNRVICCTCEQSLKRRKKKVVSSKLHVYPSDVLFKRNYDQKCRMGDKKSDDSTDVPYEMTDERKLKNKEFEKYFYNAYQFRDYIKRKKKVVVSSTRVGGEHYLTPTQFDEVIHSRKKVKHDEDEHLSDANYEGYVPEDDYVEEDEEDQDSSSEDESGERVETLEESSRAITDELESAIGNGTESKLSSNLKACSDSRDKPRRVEADDILDYNRLIYPINKTLSDSDSGQDEKSISSAKEVIKTNLRHDYSTLSEDSSEDDKMFSFDLVREPSTISTLSENLDSFLNHDPAVSEQLAEDYRTDDEELKSNLKQLYEACRNGEKSEQQIDNPYAELKPNRIESSTPLQDLIKFLLVNYRKTLDKNVIILDEDQLKLKVNRTLDERKSATTLNDEHNNEDELNDLMECKSMSGSSVSLNDGDIDNLGDTLRKPAERTSVMSVLDENTIPSKLLPLIYHGNKKLMRPLRTVSQLSSLYSDRSNRFDESKNYPSLTTLMDDNDLTVSMEERTTELTRQSNEESEVVADELVNEESIIKRSSMAAENNRASENNDGPRRASANKKLSTDGAEEKSQAAMVEGFYCSEPSIASLVCKIPDNYEHLFYIDDDYSYRIEEKILDKIGWDKAPYYKAGKSYFLEHSNAPLLESFMNDRVTGGRDQLAMNQLNEYAKICKEIPSDKSVSEEKYYLSNFFYKTGLTWDDDSEEFKLIPGKSDIDLSASNLNDASLFVPHLSQTKLVSYSENAISAEEFVTRFPCQQQLPILESLKDKVWNELIKIGRAAWLQKETAVADEEGDGSELHLPTKKDTSEFGTFTVKIPVGLNMPTEAKPEEQTNPYGVKRVTEELSDYEDGVAININQASVTDTRYAWRQFRRVSSAHKRKSSFKKRTDLDPSRTIQTYEVYAMRISKKARPLWRQFTCRTESCMAFNKKKFKEQRNNYYSIIKLEDFIEDTVGSPELNLLNIYYDQTILEQGSSCEQHECVELDMQGESSHPTTPDSHHSYHLVSIPPKKKSSGSCESSSSSSSSFGDTNYTTDGGGSLLSSKMQLADNGADTDQSEPIKQKCLKSKKRLKFKNKLNRNLSTTTFDGKSDYDSFDDLEIDEDSYEEKIFKNLPFECDSFVDEEEETDSDLDDEVSSHKVARVNETNDIAPVTEVEKKIKRKRRCIDDSFNIYQDMEYSSPDIIQVTDDENSCVLVTSEAEVDESEEYGAYKFDSSSQDECGSGVCSGETYFEGDESKHEESQTDDEKLLQEIFNRQRLGVKRQSSDIVVHGCEERCKEECKHYHRRPVLWITKESPILKRTLSEVSSATRIEHEYLLAAMLYTEPYLSDELIEAESLDFLEAAEEAAEEEEDAHKEAMASWLSLFDEMLSEEEEESAEQVVFRQELQTVGYPTTDRPSFIINYLTRIKDTQLYPQKLFLYQTLVDEEAAAEEEDEGNETGKDPSATSDLDLFEPYDLPESPARSSSSDHAIPVEYLKYYNFDAEERTKDESFNTIYMLERLNLIECVYLDVDCTEDQPKRHETKQTLDNDGPTRRLVDDLLDKHLVLKDYNIPNHVDDERKPSSPELEQTVSSRTAEEASAKSTEPQVCWENEMKPAIFSFDECGEAEVLERKPEKLWSLRDEITRESIQVTLNVENIPRETVLERLQNDEYDVEGRIACGLQKEGTIAIELEEADISVTELKQQTGSVVSSVNSLVSQMLTDADDNSSHEMLKYLKNEMESYAPNDTVKWLESYCGCYREMYKSFHETMRFYAKEMEQITPKLEHIVVLDWAVDFGTQSDIISTLNDWKTIEGNDFDDFLLNLVIPFSKFKILETLDSLIATSGRFGDMYLRTCLMSAKTRKLCVKNLTRTWLFALNFLLEEKFETIKQNEDKVFNAKMFTLEMEEVYPMICRKISTEPYLVKIKDHLFNDPRYSIYKQQFDDGRSIVPRQKEPCYGLVHKMNNQCLEEIDLITGQKLAIISTNRVDCNWADKKLRKLLDKKVKAIKQLFNKMKTIDRDSCLPHSCLSKLDLALCSQRFYFYELSYYMNQVKCYARRPPVGQMGRPFLALNPSRYERWAPRQAIPFDEHDDDFIFQVCWAHYNYPASLWSEYRLTDSSESDDTGEYYWDQMHEHRKVLWDKLEEGEQTKRIQTALVDTKKKRKLVKQVFKLKTKKYNKKIEYSITYDDYSPPARGIAPFVAKTAEFRSPLAANILDTMNWISRSKYRQLSTRRLYKVFKSRSRAIKAYTSKIQPVVLSEKYDDKTELFEAAPRGDIECEKLLTPEHLMKDLESEPSVVSVRPTPIQAMTETATRMALRAKVVEKKLPPIMERLQRSGLADKYLLKHSQHIDMKAVAIVDMLFNDPTDFFLRLDRRTSEERSLYRTYTNCNKKLKHIYKKMRRDKFKAQLEAALAAQNNKAHLQKCLYLKYLTPDRLRARHPPPIISKQVLTGGPIDLWSEQLMPSIKSLADVRPDEQPFDFNTLKDFTASVETLELPSIEIMQVQPCQLVRNFRDDWEYLLKPSRRDERKKNRIVCTIQDQRIVEGLETVDLSHVSLVSATKSYGINIRCEAVDTTKLESSSSSDILRKRRKVKLKPSYSAVSVEIKPPAYSKELLWSTVDVMKNLNMNLHLEDRMTESDLAKLKPMLERVTGKSVPMKLLEELALKAKEEETARRNMINQYMRKYRPQHVFKHMQGKGKGKSKVKKKKKKGKGKVKKKKKGRGKVKKCARSGRKAKGRQQCR